eukprot:GHVN01044376.1.p1 GENE.GHVN01044376.1~~GHVN01044376.1.p1  ORF type:complete len:734 (+),score=81.82 GHVN01044376.1:74-2275(+)
MSCQLKCTNLPGQEVAFTNCAYVSVAQHAALGKLSSSPGPVRCAIKNLILNVEGDKRVEDGTIGLNKIQRACASIRTDETITVSITSPNGIAVAGVAEFEVSTFLKSDKVTLKESDCDEGFKKSFSQHVMCENQELALQQGGVLVRYRMIRILPLQLGDGKVQPGKVSKALLTAQTEFSFVANESSSNIQIQPKKPVQRHIFRPDFNFEELGIGGLDKEFADIFRRAFASRIFPANVIQELGIHHVRGMLLYGPPGTGKTLIARQIGKALQARPPKLVNGPEILNKFVGQSEENIRNLFKEAEDEQKKKGDNSQLHIIIFDEIDAICKQRGTTSSGTGVNDSIVNQLLSKIDGVDSLNNILLIGMTNRLDMLDEAILRPGRLEVHIEVGLPDESGRVQILNIHTQKMRQAGRLGNDVSIQELATQTKNFSGAEIEGLVRSAASWAFNRNVDVKNLQKPMNSDNVKVLREDFEFALSEIKPAFGVQENEFEACYSNGIISFGKEFEHLRENLLVLARQAQESVQTPMVTILLHGPPGSGKTALAAHIASRSDFPFMKMITPENFVGHSETAKALLIAKVFDDAYKSTKSLIVLDNIERLIDFSPVGPRYGNTIMQALLVLVKKAPPKQGRRLMVIGTTSEFHFFQECGFVSSFQANFGVPLVSSATHLKAVLGARHRERGDFPPEEIDLITRSIMDPIGIKQLLLVADMAAEYCKPEKVKCASFLACLKDCGHQ